MRRITLKGLYDCVIVLCVNDLHDRMTRTNQIADDGWGERFISTGDDCVTLADILKRNLRADHFLVKLIRQLDGFNLVE